MDEAADKGLPIVYLDEVNFTKSTYQSKELSLQSENLTVDQRLIYTPYKSVIAAISSERGVVLIHLFNSAVDHTDFKMFLRALSNQMGRRPFALMMDQLAVHRHKEVKQAYEELDIRPIFNVGYSP